MKIAYDNSRMEKKLKNNEVSWDDFCKRVNTTQTTTETVDEYRKMSKPQQDAIKNVGGFVAGHLKAGRRKNGTVLCRSMLMLDMARTLVVLKLRDSITDANIQVQRSLLILLIRLVDIIIIICKL